MYHLSGAADDDLAEIYADGLVEYGEQAAWAYVQGLFGTFELLARFPNMAHERTELMPPMRVHMYGAHGVIYRVDADGSILIVRVRHAREDWLKI